MGGPSFLQEIRRALLVVCEKNEIRRLDGSTEGYAIKPHGWAWTAYTVYPAGLIGLGRAISVYAAQPDIAKGIDIEDERLTMSGSVFAVQCFLRGALNRPVPDAVILSSMSQRDAKKFLSTAATAGGEPPKKG